jgi:hypothetical protein
MKELEEEMVRGDRGSSLVSRKHEVGSSRKPTQWQWLALW